MFHMMRIAFVLVGALSVACGCSAFSTSPLRMLSRGNTCTAECQHEISYTRSCLFESKKEGPEKPKELTSDTVAEMMEVVFVNACLQLAQGYVDVLKLFIVAVKAGYELDMNPSAMIESVDSIPHQSAGRDLMPEEVRLRNTWIHVIHLVLETLKHEKKVTMDDGTIAAIDVQVRDTFSADLLADMKAQHDAGDAFHLEHWLDKYFFPKINDPVEKAIVSQSLRVIWFTHTVLGEERVCMEEKSGLKARPPIPGAFD